MSDIQDLSIVDNDNQDLWPEGSMRVNDVNDAGRADEGLMARWFADWNGSTITTGTATAYAVASDTKPTAYYDGFKIVAEIHIENGPAATLNSDSLGAIPIVKNGGEALEEGDLPIGFLAIFIYRGTDFNLAAVKIGTAGTKDVGTAIGNVTQLIDDGGGNATMPAVQGELLTNTIAGQTVENVVDPATDLIAFYDDSAGENRQTIIQTLIDEALANITDAQLAKAWVNFDGTTAGIRSSYNVASVVRNTAGDYTITFTANAPTANIVVTGTCASGSEISTSVQTNSVIPVSTSVSNTRIFTVRQGSNALDLSFVYVAVYW